MINKLKILLPIFLILLLNSCGFKVANQSDSMSFSIGSILTSGDSRIGYRIKSNLLPYSTMNSKNVINLEINVSKSKTIKEKNIKNEVTKYLVSINALVDYGKEENKKFSITKAGDLPVSNQYSQTLNSEKKLIKSLSEDLAEDIIEELLERMNDI
tara:strand:+ start:632 stop:1099 length:468 start_codon:yes stop_codon:yes gene_type:complete